MSREHADTSGTDHIPYLEEVSVGALTVVPKNTVRHMSRSFLKPRIFVPWSLFPYYQQWERPLHRVLVAFTPSVTVSLGSEVQPHWKIVSL